MVVLDCCSREPSRNSLPPRKGIAMTSQIQVDDVATRVGDTNSKIADRREFSSSKPKNTGRHFKTAQNQSEPPIIPIRES